MNIRWVLTLVALVLSQIPFARAAEQVDLLLVLAMDVSRSMDQAKFRRSRDIPGPYAHSKHKSERQIDRVLGGPAFRRWP